MVMNYKTQVINGTTYAFTDKSIWNSEKKRCEHKRKYIGKVVDGKLVYSKKYLLEKQIEEQKTAKPGPVPATMCKRSFYGAVYLLSCIAEKIGMADDLKACFGGIDKELMSLAFYLVLEEGQAMYRFKKWGYTHTHPFGADIPSQRISRLFAMVTEDAKMAYFKRQAKRRCETEYLAFDTTSISSFSELLKQVKYGKNKEGDDLPQINLALLFGEASMLPVYYRKLPGNIADVKTIDNLLRDVDFLNLEKLQLCMDRGFFSKKNINELMKHHHKFLIGARTGLKLVKTHLDAIRDTFITRSNYNPALQLYVGSFTEQWDYEEEKPRLGTTVTGKRRVYLHIYYNDQHCTDDRNRFNHMLDQYEEELRTKKRKKEHESAYAKYFIVHETPARGIAITYNDKAIREAEKDFGYFALLTNSIKDPAEAIQIYRMRDLIEKSFENLKERLNMRRMSVSSEESFEGKLFVQFLALELLSYIKHQMEIHGLFKNYTMQELLDELDTIEYYQQPGKAHHLSEITAKQAKLYEMMDVAIPT